MSSVLSGVGSIHISFVKNSSKKSNPRWVMVDVKYVRPLKRMIFLKELKTWHQKHCGTGGPLKNLSLFTRARLSVQPITKEEWNFILNLENDSPEDE